MKTRASLTCIALVAWIVACSGGDADRSVALEPVLVADLASRSVPLRCETQAWLSELAGSVEEATVSAGGTVVVVDKLSRTVNLFDRQLQRTQTLALPKQGPGAVLSATSATVDGDSVLYIADQLGRRVQVYRTDGVHLRTIATDFFPGRARVHQGALYATATVLADRPASLIHRHNGLGWEELGVPPRTASDYLMRATANALAVAEHGPRLLFAHQFIEPFGYIVADGPPRQVALPVADAFASDIGFIPARPAEERELERVLVGAIALSAMRDGGLLYLTRSGRRTNDAFERAVVQVDSGYTFVGAWSTSIRAGHLLALPDRNTILLIDDEDVWYQCPLT